MPPLLRSLQRFDHFDGRKRRPLIERRGSCEFALRPDA